MKLSTKIAIIVSGYLGGCCLYLLFSAIFGGLTEFEKQNLFSGQFYIIPLALSLIFCILFAWTIIALIADDQEDMRNPVKIKCSACGEYIGLEMNLDSEESSKIDSNHVYIKDDGSLKKAPATTYYNVGNIENTCPRCNALNKFSIWWSSTIEKK